MMFSSPFFTARRVSALTRRALPLALVVASLIACRSSSVDAAKDQAAPSSEPERFNFALPTNYDKVELRGEGSETLRVPAGSRVTRAGEAFGVEAGSDFALEVTVDAPPLGELAQRAAGAGVARVVTEPDLAVFKSPEGYSFVVVRELVPEWDESQRQRFACTGAGAVVGRLGTPRRAFSKAAVENMVAACRTITLPPLE